MDNSKLDNMNKEIEKIKNTIENGGSFIDKILFDASKLEFSKIRNILMVILALISPVIPLIFLFRVDIIQKFDSFKILFISISINALTLMIMTILLELERDKKIELYLTKPEKYNFKIRFLSFIIYKIIINIKSIESKVKTKSDMFYMKKIYLLRKASILLSIMRLLYKKGDKLIKKSNVDLKKCNTYRNRNKNFIIFTAILFNIIAGGLIIAIKVFLYLNIRHYGFKETIVSLVIFYSFFILEFAFVNVRIFYYKLGKVLYRYLCTKYKKDNVSQIQISFFENE